MQEDNTDQPPSLSQLLRESYLAEARAQQRHSEMSRSDGSSTRLQIYGSLKGKAEDSVGNSDPQLPDLSAFLSQEELDKSVNLARQAIGHEPHEERGEVKTSVTPLTPSNISAVSVSSSTSPSLPLTNPSPAPFGAPSTVSFAQPAPELKDLPEATHTAFTPDRKMHKASTQQDNMIRNSRESSEGFNDLNRPAKTTSYGLETQSKKEFLNKAADFIEELSSLFKANSSKRVRPRACKGHRSRVQNKSQNDGTVCPLSSDNRERAVLPMEVEKEGLRPAVSHQPDIQLDSGVGHAEFQDCRTTDEQQYNPVSQEVEEEAENCALTEASYPAEASVCEPPRFIQKLKSREIPEGSKVQLDCIVRGHPVPEVRWFCEGKELENSPDIQIITNGELHSLIIAEAFEEDTGRYSCFASNFYGTDSTSAEIYVEGDSSVHFYTFYRLMLNTVSDELFISVCNPAGTSTTALSVPELSKVPVATPAHTAQEKTTSIPVQVFPTLSQSDAEFAEAPTSGTDISTPQLLNPGISSSLQDILATEGQLVVLECRVKGVPSPHVDWHREGKIVEDSPEFRILQKKPRSPAEAEEICTLVIAEVFPEDSGMFTCTASNNYGTVSSSADLKVKVVWFCLTNRDPAQLQLLHNQVLMEQQQETEPQTPTHILPQSQFIAAQTFSPVMSPSPTESPVPLLQELAAELNSSAASSPTLPPFSPPPRTFPTRVLMSPTSPPSLVSSPTPGSALFPNSVFALRAQSPPQASSPTSSSSTPSPILNPVAFLSSVLPSLTPSQPTNSMGLPKGAPLGPQKKVPKMRLPSTEDIRESKEILLQDIEKKLRFKDDTPHFAHQQKLCNEGKTASRPLGPIIPATVINYDEVQGFFHILVFLLQEYKVSSFEQRLMSEIEFRLERTPVEESDDEVQHDDVPTGKCIAPIFDKKLKNFRAMEGGPVTFSCKIVGIPIPKVYWFKDGKQILKKNVHYKKIREGDGTCGLHIECTTSDDDGNYTIMAANPQGRISCSGHLIVQTGPPRNRLTPIHSQRVRSRIQEVEGEQTQELFFRPHFLQAPGDLLAHEGRLCRLDCKVSGLPNPELMWLVNGRPIYPDLMHKMLVRENGVHSLVIDPLTQNDGGTYTCIASNKAGQSSFSLELKVVEKEMKHPPQFVEKLQNMGIPEGTPVRLECRVVGMPPPLIFWKKDNDTIPRSKDRISMTQDATGYVCLLIQPTTKDDAGWYTVSAKNEVGIVSCTCRLDIYAQWHQGIPAPMKKTPRTGSRYAALTGQGLDIKAVFPTSETSPILFSSSPPEVMLESEEL
uniref:Myopalladin n=1 Tax=Anabas testudineus TaxID=64144 RepID=A0A7N6BD72_ANATE